MPYIIYLCQSWVYLQEMSEKVGIREDSDHYVWAALKLNGNLLSEGWDKSFWKNLVRRIQTEYSYL